MSTYSKGASWERKAKEILERLGLDVYRVAGSKGVDLVIPLVTIEIKFRTELPSYLCKAAYQYTVSETGFVARPLTSLLEHNLLPAVKIGSFGPWEKLVPSKGVLLIKGSGHPWIILGRERDIMKLVEVIGNEAVRQNAK